MKYHQIYLVCVLMVVLVGASALISFHPAERKSSPGGSSVTTDTSSTISSSPDGAAAGANQGISSTRSDETYDVGIDSVLEPEDEGYFIANQSGNITRAEVL